ncbi:MAG: phytoene/squalene synthase family protein [Archangium sp.]
MSALHSGYESARQVTRHHAKSFYFSSAILFGERRQGAFALYAFCRRLDDLVDHPETQATPEKLQAALDSARAMVNALFERGEIRPVHPFPENELLALHDTVKKFRIPATPFLELIDGMEMDLTKHRYANWAELELYCHRVAGVVGLMMAPLLGTTDPRALKHAADLGKAMQLTNILRDVKEDLARGRVYLPQDELISAGVTDDQLRAGIVTPAIEKFLRVQIDRSRALYASALQGVPWLRGFGSMRVVRLMASIYGGILDVIEQRKLDIFSARASVSTGGKIWRLIKVIFSANPSPVRALSATLSPAGERESV